MLGSLQADKLFKKVKKEESRLVLMGDGKQLQALSAGKIFKDLQEREIPYIEMQEVVRQKTELTRQAVKHIKNYQQGKNLQGIDDVFNLLKKNNRLTEVQTKKKLVHCIKDEYLKSHDKEHVFVCLDKYQFCLKFYGRPFKNRQHFMKRMCDQAGVKRFGFHAIRHLSASILYRKGHIVSFIQKVLRHKNPTTTERYLRSLGLEDVREGMNEAFSVPSTIIPFEREKTLKTGTLEN